MFNSMFRYFFLTYHDVLSVLGDGKCRSTPQHIRVLQRARNKTNMYCAFQACYSNPCQNGGSCMEELDGYSCSCLEAYLGKNCQIPMCPADWEYAGTKCFLVTSSSASYQAAKDHCNSLDAVAMGNGMMEDPSLVSVESDEDNVILKTLITDGWIWLNCKRISGSYLCYTDRHDTQTYYRNWGCGQPDNTRDCVALEMIEGNMHDVPCSNTYTLVCQVIIKET
nr:brevican core protein-like [Lytechinus pictus]